MWWTIFTIVDLYIGIVVLDVMASSVPPEKLVRLRRTRLVILGLIAASAIMLTVQLAHRYWTRP